MDKEGKVKAAATASAICAVLAFDKKYCQKEDEKNDELYRKNDDDHNRNQSFAGYD